MNAQAVSVTKQEIQAAIAKLREAHEAASEGRVFQALSATREAICLAQHAEGTLEDECPAKEAA